jgi:hypothetical protein
MTGGRTSFLSPPKLDPSIAVKLDILGSDRQDGAPGATMRRASLFNGLRHE